MDKWIIFMLGAIVGIGLGSYFTVLAKPQKQWSELTEGERKIRIWLLSIAIVLLVIGVVVLFLFRK